MVSKCAAPGCRIRYECLLEHQLTTFHFLLKKIELNKQWVRFVNRKDWEPTNNLSKLHFEESFIIRGKKCNLNWSMNPFNFSFLYQPETLLFTILVFHAKPYNIILKYLYLKVVFLFRMQLNSVSSMNTHRKFYELLKADQERVNVTQHQ